MGPIIEELCTITRETLITVGTEKEALLVQDWGKEMDRGMEVTETPLILSTISGSAEYCLVDKEYML